MIARLLAAVLAGAVALPGVAVAAPPLSPRAIVKRLNAERSRLGLPARVQEVPEWSQRCAAHNRWMAVNTIAHGESPGSEDFSEAGDWAGSNSVLALGTTWRDGNPWTDAPLHLMQLFDPGLRRVGASDAFGASCVTTWPGIRAGAARRVWTVPALRRRHTGVATRLGSAVHAAGARRDRRRYGHGAISLRVVGRVLRAR